MNAQFEMKNYEKPLRRGECVRVRTKWKIGEEYHGEMPKQSKNVDPRPQKVKKDNRDAQKKRETD